MIRWAILSIVLALAAPLFAEEPKYVEFGEFLEQFRADHNTLR